MERACSSIPEPLARCSLEQHSRQPLPQGPGQRDRRAPARRGNDDLHENSDIGRKIDEQELDEAPKLDQAYELVDLLAEHVEVVSGEAATQFALEHHRRKLSVQPHFSCG